MDRKFYKLPIELSSLFTTGDFSIPTCTERESIDQNIDLLLSTCPGEHQFDKSWGCRIWEMDFVIVSARKQWEEQFKKHIREAIEHFEKRLKNILIDIQISEVTHNDEILNTTAIKKKVVVYVNANLISTNERCGFRYTIFLGPLSTE